MKPSLQLRTSQNLAMTPQLQQAIRLLQLSSMELQMEVQQALESNMMLELDEDDENNESSEHQFDDAAAVNVAADEEKSGIDADEEKGGHVSVLPGCACPDGAKRQRQDHQCFHKDIYDNTAI